MIKIYKKLFPLLILTIVLLSLNSIENIFNPISTSSGINKKQIREGRKEWIDEMHKTTEDLDWQQIKFQNEKNKLAKVIETRKQMLNSSLLKSNSKITEEIADGALKGHWIEVGSANVAGRIETAEIDFENNKIYCVADGGQVWVSPIEGNDWNSISDYMKFNNAMTLDLIKMNNTKRILVGDRSPARFMYTDNEGLTWNEAAGLSNLDSYSKVQKVVITNHDNPIIYAYVSEYSYTHWNYDARIYRSFNLGESFSLFKTFSKGSDTDILLTSENKLLATKNNELFEIDEAGNEYFVSAIPFNSTHKYDRDFTSIKSSVSEDKSIIYLMGQKEKSCFFYRSEDFGKSWEYRGSVDEAAFTDIRSFSVSQKYPNHIYYGGINCYRSYDGGVSWSKVNNWGDYYNNVEFRLHADIPEVNHFYDKDNNEIILVSTDGGLYYSTDSLKNVKNITIETMRNSQYYSIYTHPDKLNHIWAGSQDQGFQVSNIFDNQSEMKKFRQVVSGDYGHLVSTDNKVVWSVYPGFLLRTYGITTVSRQSMEFSYPNTLWLPPIVNDPEDRDVVYFAGGTSSGAHILKMVYQDGQISEEILPFDFDEGEVGTKISALAISPHDFDNRYVLNTRGSFFYSYDGGTKWRKTNFTGPGSHYFYGSTICPSTKYKDKIYIGGNGYSNPGVYVSNNNGQSFEAMNNGLPKTLIFDLAVSDDDEFVFAATEIGPYVYIKEKDEWFDLAGISAPAQQYWSVQYLTKDNRVRFGTYGRGIWDFKVEEITSIVIDEIPESFMLSNYPNPFNPSTTINYSLAKNSDIKIRIINSNGQLIKEMFSGNKTKGEYELIWNGKNNNGSEVSSGVYFVQLITEKGIKTHKIIKLK